jgi:dipeptidyl aminopeptidase/acylaminoacyl peptidase
MKPGFHYTIVTLSVVVLLSLDSFSQQVTPNKPTRGWLTVDTIMRDPKWMGASPSRVFWSEGGEYLYFELGQGGAAAARGRGAEPDSLFVVSAKGGTPRLVTIEERKRLPGRTGVYSKDWSKKLYTKSGDIFLLDIRNKKEVQLTSTSTPESNPRFSSDEQKIVFERTGNLFVRDLRTAAEVQITNFQGGGAAQDSPRGAAESQFSGFQGRGSSRDASRTDTPKYLEKQQLELFEVLRERKAERDAQKKLSELLDLKRPKQYNTGQKSAFGFVLSTDERFVTFTMTQLLTDVKRTIVPNYVTESGYTEDIPGRTKVGEPPSVNEFYVYNIGLDSVMQVRVDDIPGVFPSKLARDTVRMRQRPRPVSFNGPYWSEDGKHAFVQVFSDDHKDRWIVLLDAEKAKFTTVLEHQHDDAWIGGPGIRGFGFTAGVGWMPDSRRIYFQSEEDGWSHLYTVTLDGKIKAQLTKGTFELYGPQISKDKKRWYFISNEVHYGERHFYSMLLEGGQRTRITTMEGRNDVTLSPREDRAAILYSFSNKMPELFLMDNKPGAKAQQITFSASQEFHSYDWRAPEIFTIKARDSAAIPARLYRPDHPNGAAVIFVHGAGYLQNAHKWWSDYFHEYLFNNLLADKGYMVLDMDYRASAGLGRDWRTAVYRHMGGKDLDDQVDGAQWLVQNCGVNPKKIGLYGGSYGGFITLMALFTAPNIFAAGAALRPVTEWAHYSQGYTSEILNVPQEDTLAYRQSSPIYFANGLKGALLICHGMVDENVHFQDAVRLVQRLIELKKDNWELAVFPVEDHGFREPTSWMNEYRRILKLFETNLVGK